MVTIKNYNLYMDDLMVLEDISINLGHQVYLLSGQMHKRKSLLLNEIANAYTSYNSNIKYSNESGVAYLPNSRFLIENLTIKQNIEFFGKFFGCSNIQVRVISNHFELDGYIDRKVNSLAADIKQLVRIACAVLNTNASVYLFDNLFLNLNNSQVNIVKSYLNRLVDENTIIISKLNDHHLTDLNPRSIEIVDKKLVFKEHNV